MSVRTSESGQLAAKERLHRRKARSEDHKHPVNVVHHEEATFGEGLADKIASGIGSWRFLIIQTIAVLCWVTFNLIGLINHWDPFPFILLNLLFSVQAAYTGPVLLLAGNRQAQKDRLTLEHAADEADKADQQNVEILNAIKQISELTEKNTEVTVTILRHVESLVQQHIDDVAARKQGEANRT